MRIFIVFLLSFWMKTAMAAPLPMVSLHDFHFSRCLIHYEPQAQSLQITLHLFIDDLELALEQQGIMTQFIGSEREAESANQYIQAYLNQRLRLLVDGEMVYYAYLGKELSEDMTAIWCYLEVEDVQPTEQLMVEYGVLMELYDDQKNIVQVEGLTARDAYFIFTRDKYKDIIKI